jgi:hypothetical protein
MLEEWFHGRARPVMKRHPSGVFLEHQQKSLECGGGIRGVCLHEERLSVQILNDVGSSGLFIK